MTTTITTTPPSLGSLQAQLEPQLAGLATPNGSPYASLGRVERLIGLLIESRGPQAKLGDLCWIDTTPTLANPLAKPLPAEVVGFREGRLLLAPLGELSALTPGAWVRTHGEPFKVPVGKALLGRVLNGLGEPLDGRFALDGLAQQEVYAAPPHPLQRQDVDTVSPMGVRALDGFLTMGRGQRVGVFAGSGVGKSTLLGMMARNSTADINVIALIGERGREVREFLDEALGPEGLARSVVVVATSEQPALVKLKAALVATTLAEYFRDEGQHVLLMMDSVTRVAMALREQGLAAGEPPTTKGYPPSVFAFMPKLLERAGMGPEGSITGIYTVLVEGDDMNEPIADLTRGLLDGHVVLSRHLAHKNHFPAIEVGASVSRVFNALVSPEHRQRVGALREALTLYKQNEDLLSIGAYVRGQNPKLDWAVSLKEPLDAFLRQDKDSNVGFEATEAYIEALLHQFPMP